MGRRGPPPKPTEMKVLQGTYRPDRAAENEMRAPVKEPECPPWLVGEAKNEWERVVPKLLALKVLATVDGAALAAYCQCYARWVQAEKAIAEHGLTMETSSGYVIQRPEVGIVHAELRLMRDFLTQFGMSPSSRSRVSAAGSQEAKPGNRFAQLKAS